MVAVNSIVWDIDNKQLTCVAFLGLRKAFDSSDHAILLERLCKLGVHDIELSWLGLSLYYASTILRIIGHKLCENNAGIIGCLPYQELNCY